MAGARIYTIFAEGFHKRGTSVLENRAVPTHPTIFVSLSPALMRGLIEFRPSRLRFEYLWATASSKN